MAEDIRPENTDSSLAGGKIAAITSEARRLEEDCLYTSTTFFIWLRRVRLHKRLFIILPIILGGIAGISALKAMLPDWIIAVLVFLAGLFPALADALKFETSVDEIARLAAEYKSLQDRFRRLANITSLSDINSAQKELDELSDRLDIAREQV